ncbi:MAG: metal-dependent hydrolase [Candidatus Lokiarchaeota archaeon]|nr:metal-dependent hydrolase [Candidatus Lokiarchaeota archaeon]
MNEFTHFFTGYVLARALRYKHTRFETFFLAFASLIPDMDFTVSLFVPIEHGVFTHTLVGGAMLALVVAAVAWAVKAAVNARRPGAIPVGVVTLLGLAMLGMATHLAVDSFTYYESAADATHHLFFWPAWNFPVHINTMFPGTTYGTRVLVEVAYTAAIGAAILFYQWAYRKENPFLSFSPWAWSPATAAEKGRAGRPAWGKPVVVVASIGILVSCYLLLDIVLAIVAMEAFLGACFLADTRPALRRPI